MSSQSFADATQNEKTSNVPADSRGGESGEKMSRRTMRSSSKKSASAFRTISEVATDLDVQQHVLRFWESKFSQIRPLKRGGGRRYYRPEDIALLKRIHHLLYTEGYTIKGVQKLLRDQSKKAFVEGAMTVPEASNEAAAPTQTSESPVKAGMSESERATLKAMLGELKELREMIKA
jgi:DNA-binding transcriptional MerR regulator